MEHVKQESHNVTFKGEREEEGETVLQGVGDLSAERYESPWGPAVRSHWKPDEEDLRILNEGGLVQLEVVSAVTPPVRVTVAEPDKKEQ